MTLTHYLVKIVIQLAKLINLIQMYFLKAAKIGKIINQKSLLIQTKVARVLKVN